jgi:hypothetical protein
MKNKKIINLLLRRAAWPRTAGRWMMILAATMMTALNGWAKKVDVNTAQQLAQRYADTRQTTGLRSGAVGQSTVKLRYAPSMKQSGTPAQQLQLRLAQQSTDAAYYIFDTGEGDNANFVIVAGDDAVEPVLGYSDNGVFTPDNLPPAFELYLDELQNYVRSRAEQNAPQTPEIAKQWNELLNPSSAGVALRAYTTGTVLMTTKWNQWAPYNNMCPIISVNLSDPYGGRAPTGCVATSVAQIMKYHNWPAQGTGTTTAYTTDIWNIPAVTLGATYDWNNMQPTYGNPTNHTGSSTQNNAVALLMYHVGVSLQMGYTPEGSGSHGMVVPGALKTHFKYASDARYVTCDGYTVEEWRAMLKGEINAERPILTGCCAHAMVIDGYDASSRFHLNFGWGGSTDGFYVATNNINNNTIPGSQYQNVFLGDAVIGIRPNNTSAYSLALQDQFTVTDTAFFTTESVGATAKVANWGNAPFSGEIKLALVNNSTGAIAYTLATQTVSIAAGASSTLTFNNASLAGVANGQYRLRIAYGSTPTLIDRKDNCPIGHNMLIGAYSPNLTGLTVSVGTLTPAFSPHVLDYTVIIPNGTTSVTITATGGGTITGVGAKTPSVGANSYPITVTATSGGSKRTYNVQVYRKPTAAALPFTENFETAGNHKNWLSIHRMPYQWMIDKGVGKANFDDGTLGQYSAYITDGTKNGSNFYTHSNRPDAFTSHVIREVNFDANVNGYKLSFDWNAGGLDNNFRIYLLDVGATVTADAFPAGTPVFQRNSSGNYNWGDVWRHDEILLPAALCSGQTKQLVFSWNNPNNQGRMYASVDNIEIKKITVSTYNTPFTENFESAATHENWLATPVSVPFAWKVGTGVMKNRLNGVTLGTYSAYMTNSSGNHGNTGGGDTEISHIYSFVHFTSNPNGYKLSFDWMGGGYSNNFRVYLLEESAALNPNAYPDAIPVFQNGSSGNGQWGDNWLSAAVTLLAESYAGKTMKLVFSWQCSHSAVPAAIDNIQIAAVTPIVVANANDAGVGSLRQAITDAPAGSLITFNESLANSTITLSSMLPDINKTLLIEGNGVTISGNNTQRILNVTNGGNLTVRRIHFKNAQSSGNASVGGAITVASSTSGKLTLHSCIFNSNKNGYGSAVLVGNNTQAYINGCTFYNNEHHFILFRNGSRTTLAGNIFIGNNSNEGVLNESNNTVNNGYNVFYGFNSNKTFYDKDITLSSDVTASSAPVNTTTFEPLNSQTKIVPAGLSGFPTIDFRGTDREPYPTYAGAINKPTSSNADLSALAVAGQTLTPTFSPSVTAYTLAGGDLSNSVASLTITATLADAAAAVTGTGAQSISVGSNTLSVVVTAESGITKTYTITCTRRDAKMLTLNVTNGSISGATTGNKDVGSLVSITALPNSGYQFVNWTAAGITLIDATANPLNFSMPNNAVTLTANFTQESNTDVTVTSVTQLKAWTQGDRLHITGLPIGQPWCLYNIQGIAIYQGIVAGEEIDVMLPSRGFYLVKSDNRTVKVMY